MTRCLQLTLFFISNYVSLSTTQQPIDPHCLQNEIDSLFTTLDTSLIAPENISQSSMDLQTRTYARQVANAVLNEIGSLEHCHNDGQCILDQVSEKEGETKFLLMSLDNIPAKGDHKLEMNSIIKSIEHVVEQHTSSIESLRLCLGLLEESMPSSDDIET